MMSFFLQTQQKKDINKKYLEEKCTYTLANMINFVLVPMVIPTSSSNNHSNNNCSNKHVETVIEA
jgi:hypothetical protein